VSNDGNDYRRIDDDIHLKLRTHSELYNCTTLG
jgi:hypothetical protein